MHDALKAIFDEHADPTHCGRARLHQQLDPIADIVTAIHMQVLTYRQLVGRAKRAGLDAGYEFKLEHIDQTFRGLQESAQALDQLVARITDQTSMLDRYLADAQADCERLFVSEQATGGEGIPRNVRGRGTIAAVTPRKRAATS